MAEEQQTYKDRIERAVAHLANNPDLDDLFAAYPDLTIEDVKACLAYAHDAVEEKRGTPPPQV